MITFHILIYVKNLNFCQLGLFLQYLNKAIVLSYEFKLTSISKQQNIPPNRQLNDSIESSLKHKKTLCPEIHFNNVIVSVFALRYCVH